MDLTSSDHCPRCGASLEQGSVDGLCAKCLGALNFSPDTAMPGEAAAPVSSPTPEDISKHFPQLEIIEFLGRGGMGVVYKARQKVLGRLVALKLLAPERAGEPKFSERFLHEAKALAALNHPNIVTIHDFGEAGGFYYLLMEFVDGVNLRQAMKAGRFTPEQALAIVPPVCEALQYAHEHGIVHRDIKPENLLLDKEGRVKIADFGIAKILGTESSGVGLSESQPAGTPQYMAPEQKEHRVTDHRADIYSLGVVLYEMLTGELPTDKLQPPSKRVQVDVRIDEIVLRALEAKPALRYQTAGEFRTQVETFVGIPRAGATEPSTGLLKSERGRITWEDSSDRTLFAPRMGEVALFGDRLVISLGAKRREIPLGSIRALREAVPPIWWAPAGHSYAAVEFDEGGKRRLLAFLPGTAAFRTVSDAQRHAAEWLTALQAAVQIATGRAMALTPGKLHLPFTVTVAAFFWLVPFTMWGVWMLNILFTRRAGTGPPLEIFLPLMVVFGLLGAFAWSRLSRPIVADRPAPGENPRPPASRRFSRMAIIAALGILIGLPVAFVVRQTRTADAASGSGIERVEIAEDRAVVRQRRFDGEGMIVTFGPMTNRWTPSGVYLDAMFDITLEPARFGSGASWVVKGRHGIHLLYRLDGPPGPMLGKIVFHSGTPAPESDGSYVIGEFRPDAGEPLPIAVRLENDKQTKPFPAGEHASPGK